MSGRWMTAGDRFAGYRADVPGARGDGAVANLPTRMVLQRLCRTAHDVGVAQVSVAVIADRIGISERATKYALARLERDAVITRAVRGTGNRHGTQPRATVYVLHPLPDVDGVLWPDPDWLALQWSVYVTSRWWLALDRANRQAVRDAWAGVDNPGGAGLLRASLGPTTGKPLPDSSQVTTQKQDPPRTHPKAAARARGRLALLTATSQRQDQP